MRVSEIMSKEIVTISPDKRVGQALQLMQKHQIRHLPVLEGGRMVGWIRGGDDCGEQRSRARYCPTGRQGRRLLLRRLRWDAS